MSKQNEITVKGTIENIKNDLSGSLKCLNISVKNHLVEDINQEEFCVTNKEFKKLRFKKGDKVVLIGEWSWIQEHYGAKKHYFPEWYGIKKVK